MKIVITGLDELHTHNDVEYMDAFIDMSERIKNARADLANKDVNNIVLMGECYCDVCGEVVCTIAFDVKCEHKTSMELLETDNVRVSRCTWGCDSILVSVYDNTEGLTYTYTTDELLGKVKK